MKRLANGFLVCLALLSAFGVRCSAFGSEPSDPTIAAPVPAAPTPNTEHPPASGVPTPNTQHRPSASRPVFGEVSAVRGNVLQIRAEESEGLTRVILASDAQIIRDEKLSMAVLQPGAKVMGMGRPVEGTGTGAIPLKVEVQRLMVQEAGRGGPFSMFGPGDRGGPLMRGRRAAVFRKQNYSGNIQFDATVQSVHPLVLIDDQGSPLNVVVGDDLEVHERNPRPIKEGDVTAGAQLAAIGDTTPDGLLNAHTIVLFDEGNSRGSVSATIMAVTDKSVTVRPRFAPKEIPVEIDPAAKFYSMENLDLDSIHAGDTLAFTGKVIDGDAKTPTALVLRTISPVDSDLPAINENQGGPFGGSSATATVKGKITTLAPLRVRTEDGREVAITVPGQIVYVRYRPLERSALKAGQKALLSGRSKEGGVVADLIILNPSPAMGGGF